MNVLSLFDGMSCGQIALNRINIKYDNYFASEIDKYAIKITQKNYPNTIQIGDITKVSFKDGTLYTENGEFNVGKIDLLMGGSPCQGFSFAGKGLNFDDPRSKLFFEYVRILNECKPKWFLLENVKMKKDYQDIISSYVNVQPIEINSALVSAQNRRRLYWTNIKNVNQPEDKGLVLKDILDNTKDKKIRNIKGFVCFHENEKSVSIITKNNTRKFTLGNELSKTCYKFLYSLNSTTTPYIFENNNARMLTCLECERLQTVPDNYTEGVSNTQRHKMLGNGWTVDVICHILKNINETFKYLNDNDL